MTLEFDEKRWKHGTPLTEYQINEELYSGATGVLYSSVHRQSNAHYALVMINYLEMSESTRERFHDSIPFAADFLHPNIASIRELWRLDELAFFIVDLPEGQPLTRAFSPPLRRHGKDAANGGDHVALAVRLARDVAMALGQAHGEGLTHNDLRLEDIIMKDDGSPVLTGLGWASWMKRPPVNGSPEPGYGAPSYAGTDAGPSTADPSMTGWENGIAADVYALGFILHQLLTGDAFPVEDGTPVLKKPDRMPDTLWAVICKAILKKDPVTQQIYTAAAFAEDLDLYLKPSKVRQPVKKKAPPKKATPQKAGMAQAQGSPAPVREKWWKRFLPRKFNLFISITVAAVTLVCVLALAGVVVFFPNDIQVLSLKSQTTTALEAVKEAREIVELDEREAMLRRVLDEGAYAPAVLPARVELARLYQERGQWVEALKEYLVVHYQSPSYYIGEELLALARQFYNCGKTETSDWLLGKIVDWCQGKDSAWNAMLMQKHLSLDRNALHRVACSIEGLLAGPMNRIEAFRKQGSLLLERARSMRIGQRPSPGAMWISGDFLPDNGDELARIESNELVFAGTDSELRIALPEGELPVLLSVIESEERGFRKVAIGYLSGRLELYDPIASALDSSFDLNGRLHHQVVFCDSVQGLVLAVVNDKGINLAIVDASESVDENREMQVFRFRGQTLKSLIPVDLYPDAPGQELLVIARNDQSNHQIYLLGRELARGAWKEIFRQEIEGEINCAALLEGDDGDGSELLLGLSSPRTLVTPHEDAEKELFDAGIYRLTLLCKEGKENGTDTRPAFELTSVSSFSAGSAGGNVIVSDACTGDFDQNGSEEAAFLVEYSGHGDVPPETRIFVVSDKGSALWLHCPDAEKLESGSFHGNGEEALLIDNGTCLLEVTW